MNINFILLKISITINSLLKFIGITRLQETILYIDYDISMPAINAPVLKLRCDKNSYSKIYEPKDKNTAKPNLKTNQYQNIGKTLRVAEIGSFKVGTPWLIPTYERRELLKEYHFPIEEFIRVSLVCVSTNTLESYCDDLDTFQQDIAPNLFIGEIKNSDKIALCLLIFSSLSLLTLGFCTLLSTGKTAAVALALLSATPAALMALVYCNEVQRRASFHAILYKELLRRRGQDEEGTKGILLSVET